MSGHKITPYEWWAARKFARKDKGRRLLLASLSDESSIDALNLIEQHLLASGEVSNGDKTQRMTAVKLQRDGDVVTAVFACDVAGEREVVHDRDDLEQPIFFKDAEQHVARYFSCCLIWRPTGGEQGVLLIHSPWGRGGSRIRVVELLQRALNAEDLAKAKIHAAPLVPRSELERIIRNMNATKIEYHRSTVVRSKFDPDKSTQAEMSLVVRGAGSVPFRDALAAAFRKASDKEEFFTLKLPDEDKPGDYRDVEFNDVTIDLKTAAGIKKYSLKNDTLPSVGFDKTSEINKIYYELPEDQHNEWPTLLLEGVTPILKDVLREVRD